MRVAFFGGSFDPPHVGHQMAMVYVLGTARVDELLMVPCFRHPFDKPLSDYDHRYKMACLAAKPFGGHVVVSDIERRLGGGASRTLNTVKALYGERPGDALVVVIGSDLVDERERWYGWRELSRIVEFAGRAGHGGPPLQIPDVSSTVIRARVARGDSIEGLVPAAVADYVAAHGLYRA